MLFEDAWRPSGDPANALLSSAFRKVIFGRNVAHERVSHISSSKGPVCVARIMLRAPRIDKEHTMCITGSLPSLGAWNPKEAVIMDDTDFPMWSADVVVPVGTAPVTIEYKYAIYDTAKKAIATNEDGFNRTITFVPQAGFCLIRTDEGFRYPVGSYKAAGVAIPVFALRSKSGLGVGEFNDIPGFVNWAKKAGMKLVQLLPINDTIASHSWVDSYPYAAISVHALHPLFANLESMGLKGLKDEKLKAFVETEKVRLNNKPQVDYEAVMDTKFKVFRALFEQEKAKLVADTHFQAFLKENEDWVYPYAAFSYFRDIYHTVDFRWWPRCSTFNREEIKALAQPGSADYDGVALYLFIQYHLHLQMDAASEFARSSGVCLKGDLPIGIYRFSVDAWMAPHLYNMECQTGAPPDAFAVEGQNWGFPTYNWGVMAADNFKWWRSRLTKMARHFDAYRIDHVLGFFRIWEIPYDAIQGLLGQFSPSYALSRDELRDRGIDVDFDRMCKPYIRGHLLGNFFGEYTDDARVEFLDQFAPDCYNLKPQFSSQRLVAEYCGAQIIANPARKEYYERVKQGVFGLIAEVIFLVAPFSHGNAFSPRIALQHTWSYKELSHQQQTALNAIYVHYFYHRQEGLWGEQAMQKLPAISHATDMLVCGEDLGMVPACVPPTMEKLGILSLNIQRMPKDPKKEFFHPADAPYMSVVSPSSHDMSTVRGWWEEDREVTKRFYHDILGHKDGCPYFCEPDIAKEIVVQHLHSPAMWAIFPVQDLLAMDSALRLEKPEHERINVPAIPHHYWRYRLHIANEDLIGEKCNAFNAKLLALVGESGRNCPY
eukprot:TRINITY_DN354_c0_g1_i2.p1 TRINITY_DN354_c0_g1~~TRINITY_DN354_c0_g1_i2.p1  ORF type:complete len:946 (-),score=215.46 TRINITY_DN354_c0_g1_i2:35-2518(-)